MYLQKFIWWYCCNSFWLEGIMIKKLFTYFKLGRKLAKSDVLNIVSKFKKPPLAINNFISNISFLFLVQKIT